MNETGIQITSEPPVNPPEPEFDPDPEVTREDYEYCVPKERMAAVRGTILDIQQLSDSLRYLNKTDPQAEDNFPGVIEALHKIFEQVQEYRKKVESWL